MTIFAVIGISSGSNISNIALVMNSFSESFEVSQYYVMLGLYVFMVILIVVIVEPERFAVISTLMTSLIIICIISMITNNLVIISEKKEIEPFYWFNTTNCF